MDRARALRFGDGAVSGATVVIGAKILAMLVSLVTVAIVARLLTPADYGLVAMVLSVTAFLAVFSDLGLSYVTIQRPQISHEQLSALFWANLAFGLLLGAVTAVLAPGLVWFYRDPRLLAATLSLALIFPIAAAGVQHQALLKRRMQFRRLGLVQLFGTLAGAVVSIAMALSGAGYWALVFQSLVAATVSSGSAWLLLRWLPGPPRRCPELRAMLGFGGRLTAHGVVGYLETNFDKLLLGRFCGSAPLGLYATSYTLVGRILTLSAHGVGEAAIPALSRARSSTSEMGGTYRRMFQLTCLLGLAPCAVGILWTRDVVLTVLGPQWEDAVVVLRLLFVGGVARMLAAPAGWVYVAGGRPGKMLRWELIQAPLLAVAYVVGLADGVQGVALAYALGHCVLLAPCWVYCLRGSGVRRGDILEPIIRPLLCTLLACAAGGCIQACALDGLTVGVRRLVPLLLVFGIVYGVAAIAIVPLAHEGFTQAMRLAHAVWRHRRTGPVTIAALRATTGD